MPENQRKRPSEVESLAAIIHARGVRCGGEKRLISEKWPHLIEYLDSLDDKSWAALHEELTAKNHDSFFALQRIKKELLDKIYQSCATGVGIIAYHKGSDNDGYFRFIRNEAPTVAARLDAAIADYEAADALPWFSLSKKARKAAAWAWVPDYLRQQPAPSLYDDLDRDSDSKIAESHPEIFKCRTFNGTISAWANEWLSMPKKERERVVTLSPEPLPSSFAATTTNTEEDDDDFDDSMA